MALNTIVWQFDGFDDSLCEIKELVAQDVITVKLHVAFRKYFEKPFKDAEYINQRLHYLPTEQLKTDEVDFELIQQLRKYLLNFLMVSERAFSDQHAFDSMILSKVNMFSELSFFSILISYFRKMILKHNIELVLFDQMPHYPGSYVLYLVAKAMNIKTIIFAHTMKNDQVYCMYNISDVGDILNQVPDFYEFEHKKIEKSFKKDLYYMPKVMTDRFARYVDLLSFKFFRLQTFKTMCSKFKLFKAIKKDTSASSNIHNIKFITDTSYISSLARTLLGMCYKRGFYKRAHKMYKSLVQTECDFQRNYAYFSLHYQPEATTVPLGGDYMDQAKAIEDLASILPEGYFIYVKEHPNSFGGLRSENFYQRLCNIPNLVLLDGSVENYALMEQAKIIATITGTVGWEAITGGKPVITFGYAWYNNLPGVFRFPEISDINEVINCKIDHNELEDVCSRLEQKICNVAPLWATEKKFYPEGVDRDENALKFVEIVKKMLI
ncbi:MAG: hypothetical protein HOM96_02305 [Rickettsiales bacterium]|jgi:hypothetical protein|nr:hypothetical protein [Rickettsiales bacterium]